MRLALARTLFARCVILVPTYDSLMEFVAANSYCKWYRVLGGCQTDFKGLVMSKRSLSRSTSSITRSMLRQRNIVH